MGLKFITNAFSEGDVIPKKYTCDGEDLSPQLVWQNVPDGTKSFVIIVDDPDAPVGIFVHWVVYDIPGDVRELKEGAGSLKGDSLVNGAKQGMSDFRKTGYGGPCPPIGPEHRYFFKLYALDTMLKISSKLSKAEVEKAMKGHVLEEAQFIGRYGR